MQRGRLAAVRKLAQEVKSRARVLGEDLLAERVAAAAKSAIPKLGELIAPYLAARRQEGNGDALRRLRASSMRMVRRYLDVSWKPLHKLHLDEITSKHVRDELKNIASLSELPSADRARAALSVFFVWARPHDPAGSPSGGAERRSAEAPAAAGELEPGGPVFSGAVFSARARSCAATVGPGGSIQECFHQTTERQQTKDVSAGAI